MIMRKPQDVVVKPPSWHNSFLCRQACMQEGWRSFRSPELHGGLCTFVAHRHHAQMMAGANEPQHQWHHCSNRECGSTLARLQLATEAQCRGNSTPDFWQNLLQVAQHKAYNKESN